MRQVIFILFFFLGGCLTNDQKSVETTTTTTMVAQRPLAWGVSRKDWTEHLYKTLHVLGKELLASKPSDFAQWCGKLEPIDCYAELISAMAKKESNHKPEAIYVECSAKKGTYRSEVYLPERGAKPYCIPGHKLDGGVAISRGLMQISIQSAQSYGCKITVPKELNDPFNNLDCAIRILNRWIPRDKRIASDSKVHLGAGRYWSVMRISSNSRPEILKYMASVRK